MTERDLVLAGFTPKGDSSLASPGRIVLTPSSDAYYRISIELSGGDVLTCVVAKAALKVQAAQ